MAQRHKDTWHKDIRTRGKRHKDVKTQEYKDIRIKWHKDKRTQGHKDKGTQGSNTYCHRSGDGLACPTYHCGHRLLTFSPFACRLWGVSDGGRNGSRVRALLCTFYARDKHVERRIQSCVRELCQGDSPENLRPYGGRCFRPDSGATRLTPTSSLCFCKIVLDPGNSLGLAGSLHRLQESWLYTHSDEIPARSNTVVARFSSQNSWKSLRIDGNEFETYDIYWMNIRRDIYFVIKIFLAANFLLIFYWRRFSCITFLNKK